MMKKLFLSLFVLLVLSNITPCFATYWYEFAEKSYIDLDSISKKNNLGFAWVKILNNGDIEPIGGEKIWYSLNTIYVDLKYKKISLKDVYYYGLKNNLLYNKKAEKPIWDIVVPASLADYLVETVKNYPKLKKFTDEEFWARLDETTYIDVFSLLMTNNECCNVRVKTFTNKKQNSKYIISLLSINLVKQEVAIVEAELYNKKGKKIKHIGDGNLHYSSYKNEASFIAIEEFIKELSKELEDINKK